MTLLSRIALEIIRWPIVTIWYLTGWRLNIDRLDDDKIIVAAAPHTSNWDYLYFLLVGLYLRRRPMVTVKHTLFRFPIGWFIRLAGGISIERHKSKNVVQQLSDLIEKRERIMLVFTPEGTRSYRPYWRTGFYWTAVECELPIIIAIPHYKKKEIYMDYRIEPSGDIEADIALIREQVMTRGLGLYPEKTNDIRLRSEGSPEQVEGPSVENHQAETKAQ